MDERAATSETERQLRQLGLSEDDAHVYTILRRLGPALARSVALETAMPRPRAYRILGELQRRGLVRTTLVRPQLFSAEAPETVVRCLRAEQEDTAARLARSGEAFLAATEADPPGTGPGALARGSFRLLQGPTEARTLAAYALANAAKEVRVLEVATSGSVRADGGWLRALGDVPHRIAVRVLVGPQPEAVRVLGTLVGHPRARVRRTETARDVRLLLADERELLLDLEHAGGDGANGSIWTDAPGLVRSVAGLFDIAWTAATVDAAPSIVDASSPLGLAGSA